MAFVEAETEVVVVEETDDLFQMRYVVGERVGENKDVVEVDDGERGARLIFFSDSVLTLNDGALTKSFPTLICLCLIITLAW